MNLYDRIYFLVDRILCSPASQEIDDINYGLSHFYGLYDLIHLRLVKSGFADIYKTMHEVQLCLKPGGLVIMIDHDTGFEEENRMKVKLAKVEGDEDVDGVGEDGSWLARMFHGESGLKLWG